MSIKVTGTGIDPETSPRLYSKFATKSHNGTGLGPYIPKNIIEAHGGRLYTSNNYNKGVTFTIPYHYLENKNRESHLIDLSYKGIPI